MLKIVLTGYLTEIGNVLSIVNILEPSDACRLLFASSMLGIIRTVLEETRQVELQILACTTLVDLMNSQVSTKNVLLSFLEVL